MNLPDPSRSPAPHSADEYFSLAPALAALRQHWLLAAIVALVVFALGAAYAVLAPSVYQANVLIKVDLNDAAPPTIPPALSGILDLRTGTAAEIEMLRSRAVVSRAVENARLYIEARPKYVPLIGAWLARRDRSLDGLVGARGDGIDVATFNVPETLMKKVFVLHLDSANTYTLRHGTDVEIHGQLGKPAAQAVSGGQVEIQVNAFHAEPGAEFRLQRFSTEAAVEALQKKLVVAEQGKASGIISASLNDTNPQFAKNVMNEIARQYLRQNVELKSAQAERSLAFLDTQLPQLKAAIEKSEASYNAFRNRRGAIDLSEEVKVLMQQLASAQTRLVELRQRRDELRTRFQNANPLIQGVDQQIRTVTAEIASLNTKLRGVPSTEQEMGRLTRDIKVNTDLYASLLQSAQQLRLVRASQVGSAQLIDAAVTPASPVKPPRLLIIAASAVLGLILGALAAIVRGMLSSCLNDQNALAQVAASPLMGVVPYSTNQARDVRRTRGPSEPLPLLARDTADDGAIEGLRALRAQLPRLMQDGGGNVVALVGAAPGAGASFIAGNLCALLAGAGQRVLLIDADVFQGQLHRHWGEEASPGLLDFLSGAAQAAEIVRQNVLPGLDFIARGRSTPQAGDDLAKPALAMLIQELSRRYDCVVMDAAPATAGSEALVVSAHAGVVCGVTRRAVTTRNQVEAMQARFEQSGHPITLWIFNGAKPGPHFDTAARYLAARGVQAAAQRVG